jgi:hypothetical protein
MGENKSKELKEKKRFDAPFKVIVMEEPMLPDRALVPIVSS